MIMIQTMIYIDEKLSVCMTNRLCKNMFGYTSKRQNCIQRNRKKNKVCTKIKIGILTQSVFGYEEARMRSHTQRSAIEITSSIELIMEKFKNIENKNNVS